MKLSEHLKNNKIVQILEHTHSVGNSAIFYVDGNGFFNITFDVTVTFLKFIKIKKHFSMKLDTFEKDQIVEMLKIGGLNSLI